MSRRAESWGIEALRALPLVLAGLVCVSQSYFWRSVPKKAALTPDVLVRFGLQDVPEPHLAPLTLQQMAGDPPLTFAIIMATHRRPHEQSERILRNVSCMLRQQTYPHWHVFLTGDYYVPFEEVSKALRLIPSDRLHLHNLPSPGERGRRFGKELWWSAGLKAVTESCIRAEHFFKNTSALAADRVVIARLDDDDYWSPDHLALLATQYARYPEVKFVYTAARFCKSRSALNFSIPNIKYITPGRNNKPPAADRVVHSTVSWKLQQFFGWRYHDLPELARPGPVDAANWRRMAAHMDKHGLAFSMVPKITVDHGIEDGKSCPELPERDVCANMIV